MKNDSYADRLERGFDVQPDGDRRRNDTVNFVAGESMLQSHVDAVREMAKERDALQAAVSEKPPWTTCPDCGYDIARASAKLLPLTDAEIEHIAPDEDDREAVTTVGRETEAAHGIKEQP